MPVWEYLFKVKRARESAARRIERCRIAFNNLEHQSWINCHAFKFSFHQTFTSGHRLAMRVTEALEAWKPHAKLPAKLRYNRLYACSRHAAVERGRLGCGPPISNK